MKILAQGLLFTLLFFAPSPLPSDQFYSNALIPGENVQVSSEINEYENIVPGAPIQGSVMVTHDTSEAVDMNSFRLGDKFLKVTFVQSVPMSSYSNLVISIYRFQLEGMKAGVHILPSINVKVGDKNYLAPPLTIEIPG